MKYNIELESKDLTLLGELLDAQPYSRVHELVSRMQAQITAQEAAEKVRSESAWEAIRQEWVAKELARREAEAAQGLTVEQAAGVEPPTNVMVFDKQIERG